MRLRATRLVLASLGALLALGWPAPAGAAVELPRLEPGDTGAPVRFLQEELNAWLAYARPSFGPLAEDGIFGPRTAAATRELERESGIAVDGVAEHETWTALYRLLGRRAGDVLATAKVVPEWPLPVPEWFWPWARWYLHRSEFAGEPVRSEATRPRSAPARIPEWAWRRLTALDGRSRVARADHFVEDRVQSVFGERRGAPLSVAEVTVTPQRRSEVTPGWILLTAGYENARGGRDQVAAWLRLVRGRWVPWELGRLGGPGYNGRPRLVPCDLKPAFAEAFCRPTAATDA